MPNKKDAPTTAMTIRLPVELHEQLRTYSFFSRRAINEIATQLLDDWMATKGREELVQLIAQQGMREHHATLEKLKDDD